MVTVAVSLLTAVVVAAVAAAIVPLLKRQSHTKAKGSGVTADLDVSPVRFWTTVAGAASGTFLTVYAITDVMVVAMVPALVVATLPKAFYARKKALRAAKVQTAWPDGLRDIVSSVRSGASVSAALAQLASFGPQPLRDAFDGFDVYSRSLGVPAALEMIRNDLSDATSDRVIEVLALAHERGGPSVPEILTDLADSTTRDLWLSEQIRSEALEQKINSRVVFVLPWVVLVAMTAQNGAFREFYSTTLGVVVVAIGGALSLIGIAIAARLGRQESELRVLAGPRP